MAACRSVWIDCRVAAYSGVRVKVAASLSAIAQRPGQSNASSVRTSMLSRGGVLSGAPGFSKPVCAV
jgi:hypothetical protein